MRKILLALALSAFSLSAWAQQVSTPAITALACAYNSGTQTGVSGQFMYVQCDSTGRLVTSGGSGTVPGGLNTQLQYNSNGAFGGISGATTDGTIVSLNSPIFNAPVLGTPASGVATNLTGTASGLTAGTVTTNANLTGPITSSGNATSIASQTGTGTTFAMSASPIFTGTVGTAALTATGKVTVTGGTLGDQAQVLALTATQPTTPTGTQNAITLAITSAGSASQTNTGLRLDYSAGYTGASTTTGIISSNVAVGTASTMVQSGASTSPLGNIGMNGVSTGTTTGLNVGVAAGAGNGNINAGLVGTAHTTKNSATNIGVVGSAVNAGTSPVMVGGFFSLQQTSVPAVSAALIADNGAQSQPVFLARVAGVTAFTVDSAGKTIVASGKQLQLGNAAVTGLTPGALAALTTATITFTDSTGTVYRVPAITP